ncbi:hypothetical protein J1N35_013759, partial [Gossypium stocksii]
YLMSMDVVRYDTFEFKGDMNSSYQGMLESSMERHTLVSALDFNFSVQLRLVGNPNIEIPTQNSMSSFHFNFGTPMFYAGKTYAGMPSNCMDGQSIDNIGFNVGLTRKNNVVPTTCTDKGTFNPRYVTATKVDNKEEIETNDDSIVESELDGPKIAFFL